MISASSEFKKCVKNGHKFVNYADITLKDGTVLNLGPSDFTVGGFNMNDKTTDGKFGVGFAIGKTINITIANHTNKFSAYDFYQSIIYLYVAAELADGTVLKERKGKYYVINPSTPGDTIKISGVDSMHLFDKKIDSDIQFPATLQTILSQCCTDCGVRIGFSEFDNWNFEVYERPEECTYRQIVSWAAQIAGYNARINTDDALELVWYTSAENVEENTIDGGNFFLYELEDTVDGGNFTNYEADITIDGGGFTDAATENVTKINSLSVSTDDVVITGVKVEYDEVSILRGIEGYVINVKNNPLVAGVEEAVADYLFKRIAGMQFRPLTCQTTNNPLFEPYDSCYVYDRKGNAYFTLINSVSYSINGFTTIACNAADPIRNESSYSSETAIALVEARRNTKKQLTTYDKAVQNMNMLAANSMGLYRESETQSDGSVIYYMSNRPIVKNEDGMCEFELDSVVYKMTADGFFVSEDGGITYTSGFDAEGNAVVNVLSAIGITFDWARGGNLSLGGINNQNGRLLIFDQNNKQVGQIDNAGLAFYSDTTKTQFILSPIYGLIQRDADGNEYNGFIHDVIVRTNKPQKADITNQYDIICTNYCDVSLYDTVKVTEVESLGWTSTYRKYKYTATKHNQFWSKSLIDSNLDAGYVDILLPERFHGKDWLVLLVFDGWNNDIENYAYNQIDNYGNDIPYVYDGQSWIDDYYSFYESSMSPSDGSDFRLGERTLHRIDYKNNSESKLESYGKYKSNGDIVLNATTYVVDHMTPILSETEMTPAYGAVIEKDISSNVAEKYNIALKSNTLKEPELSYQILDSDKTTLRIFCKASVNNNSNSEIYNIAQMANIRVIVSA